MPPCTHTPSRAEEIAHLPLTSAPSFCVWKDFNQKRSLIEMDEPADLGSFTAKGEGDAGYLVTAWAEAIKSLEKTAGIYHLTCFGNYRKKAHRRADKIFSNWWSLCVRRQRGGKMVYLGSSALPAGCGVYKGYF